MLLEYNKETVFGRFLPKKRNGDLLKEEKKETHEKQTEKKKEPFKKPQAMPKMDDRPGFKGIVIIAGKDIRGNIRLRRALTYVRGIGQNLSVSAANILHSKLGLAPDKEVGELSDQDIEKIDGILFNIQNQHIPKFLLNRQADMLDGTNKHIIMSDLIFNTKQDVEREKKLYTWKGYRFYYGQKVRGQRTRNSGITGMTVGVLRKAVIAAQQAQKEATGRPGTPGAAAPAAGAAAPAGAAKPAGGAAKPAEKPAAKTEKK